MELNELAQNFPEKLSALGAAYDPAVLADMFKSRRGELNARALVISGSLGAFVSSIARDWATGSLERSAAQRGAQLTRILTSLGPSFVKLGQALSLRPDLLPKPYVEALAELQVRRRCEFPPCRVASCVSQPGERAGGVQDGMAPFHSDIAFTVIEEELGRPLEEVYTHITPAPVAAASLGQVYKATLAATGETVAVKVQRPSIGPSIAVDMLLLRRLTEFIDRSQDVISQELTPLVDEFAARLFGELDYVAEGHNCERFSKLYGELPRIRTPSI